MIPIFEAITVEMIAEGVIEVVKIKSVRFRNFETIIERHPNRARGEIDARFIIGFSAGRLKVFHIYENQFGFQILKLQYDLRHHTRSSLRHKCNSITET